LILFASVIGSQSHHTPFEWLETADCRIGGVSLVVSSRRNPFFRMFRPVNDAHAHGGRDDADRWTAEIDPDFS
jgi:hypothetical protein